MNCETAEECLLDYLEGQLDAAQMYAMRSHIDTCATCRRALRETRELIDAIEHARRKQEQAWKQASRASSSGSSSAERGRSFTFEPGHQLGDFEILGEIGRGGMGVVYRARQITLNRVVALKVLPANIGQTEAAIHRFVREAQAAAKLHHTNIVPVYSQGEADGHFFYAMEFIDGPNLGRLMKDDRSAILSGLDAVALSGVGLSGELSGISRLDGSGPRRRADYRRIAGLIASVADALDHAHRMNVIHRDIKPQNLLLGKDGEFHITDFGLARLLDEPNMTVTGEMLGTPAYMSPEQVDADRERIDARTDIYSLGVTLYELLTGKRPFEGTSREQVIARVRDREPVAPRRHDSNIPIDLDTICLRAMEKSANRRYQTAEALAADLRRFAENKPIHARRVGPIEKSIKWIRRHPAKFTIAMLVVVMIAGGVAWYAQAEAAQRRALAQAEASRREKGNRKVQEAKDLLAYEDYKEGEKARKLLLEAEPLHPDEAEFMKTKGLSYVIEAPMEAKAYLREALTLRPDDVECMYILAWTLRRLDQSDASDEEIARADALLDRGDSPWADVPTVYFFRATANVRTRFEEAERDYQTAMTLQSRKSRESRYYQAMLHLGRAKNHAQYHTRSLEDFSAIEDNLRAACTFRKDDEYPRYLLSLAYKINAEIYLSHGDVAMARERFAKALIWADDAVAVQGNKPLGYAARAEFWESVSDRRGALTSFSNGTTKSKFHAGHRAHWKNDEGACPYCAWLDMPANVCLQRAVEERSNELEWCAIDLDRIDPRQYRWLDNFWLGRLDRAADDLVALKGLVPPSDDLFAWYETICPALMEAETSGVDDARRIVDAASHNVCYREATSFAGALYLLGDADGARSLLERDRSTEKVDFDEGLNTKVSAPMRWWKDTWKVLADPMFVIDPESAEFAEIDKELRAPALFFEGVIALSNGDRKAAERWLLACENCYDYERYGYLARMLRRRLQLDPQWPAWLAPSSPDPD